MSAPAIRPLRSADASLRYLARIVFEAHSAVLIGGGESDADDTFVLDVNGLPMVPGTSLAGVLHHAYAALNGEDRAKALFGDASDGDGDAHASALVVSDAVVHLSDDRPAPQTAAPLADDTALIDLLCEGVRRDRVRINARGVADERGKFDLRLVPTGARFTAEIELLTDAPHRDAAEDAWGHLLGLLRSPLLRVGGGTRSGLGALEVMSICWDRFTLTEREGRSAYLAVPRDLRRTHGLSERLAETDIVHPGGARSFALQNLRPETHWLVDGGLCEGTEDFAPLTEPVIVADGNGLGISEGRYLLPGSSLKGALAHRTRYHLHRRAGAWMTDNGTPPDGTDRVEAAFRHLFGFVPENKDDDTPAAAGCLIVNDIYYEAGPEKTLTHVAIDRFSGGVRAGMLFQERVASPREQGHRAMLYLLDPLPGEEVDPIACDALTDALNDLGAGRLTLGAGAGRGWGGFVCDGIKTTRLGGPAARGENHDT